MHCGHWISGRQLHQNYKSGVRRGAFKSENFARINPWKCLQMFQACPRETVKIRMAAGDCSYKFKETIIICQSEIRIYARITWKCAICDFLEVAASQATNCCESLPTIGCLGKVAISKFRKLPPLRSTQRNRRDPRQGFISSSPYCDIRFTRRNYTRQETTGEFGVSISCRRSGGRRERHEEVADVAPGEGDRSTSISIIIKSSCPLFSRCGKFSPCRGSHQTADDGRQPVSLPEHGTCRESAITRKVATGGQPSAIATCGSARKDPKREPHDVTALAARKDCGISRHTTRKARQLS